METAGHVGDGSGDGGRQAVSKAGEARDEGLPAGSSPALHRERRSTGSDEANAGQTRARPPHSLGGHSEMIQTVLYSRFVCLFVHEDSTDVQATSHSL